MANYNKGKIAIPNVTGDIVITITAVQQAQENSFRIPTGIVSRRIRYCLQTALRCGKGTEYSISARAAAPL